MFSKKFRRKVFPRIGKSDSNLLLHERSPPWLMRCLRNWSSVPNYISLGLCLILSYLVDSTNTEFHWWSYLSKILHIIWLMLTSLRTTWKMLLQVFMNLLRFCVCFFLLMEAKTKTKWSCDNVISWNRWKIWSSTDTVVLAKVLESIFMKRTIIYRPWRWTWSIQRIDWIFNIH